MNTNIKPFYIYTDRNSLYIKNINESAERLASNIYAYSANIDKDNNIHILAIDSIGRVIHFFNNEGIWKKKIIRKYFNSVRNIKDMRLYILNDYFNTSNYNMFRHTIDKVFKDSSSIYKLNIDELSNIIFQYKTIDILSRNICDNVIIFNNISRKWITSTPLLRSNQISLNEKNISSNIKSDIFEYCYSIKYKL